MSSASEARGGDLPADESSPSLVAPCTSITLPWPPRELSPNFRTRRASWLARLRKEYRRKCANILWDRGVQPVRDPTLREVIFHPPNKRARDLDNLIASTKALRDGLEDAMGVDDVNFNETPHRIGTPVKGGAVVVMIEIPG